MRELHVTAFVWTVTAVWVVILVLHRLTVPTGALNWISDVSAVVVALMLVFERWLWRWRIFRGWLVRRPDIHGTWRVSFESNYEGVENDGGTRRSGVLVARQTLLSLDVRLFTAESTSVSVAAEVVEEGEGGVVAYVYRNEPRVSVRMRSPMHYGAARLIVGELKPSAMMGEYWTDRGTVGEMSCFGRENRLAHEYSGEQPGGGDVTGTGQSAKG
jgi:hypothetical protein